MKVTITCGSSTTTLEVQDDLLSAVPSPQNDGRQDAAIAQIAAAFTGTYREELYRAARSASGRPDSPPDPHLPHRFQPDPTAPEWCGACSHHLGIALHCPSPAPA